MEEPSISLLSSMDFNPEKYVRELSQNCIGGQELIRLRNKIYLLSEDTNGSLKKNVYDNYTQFIDTAKEISHLESEMYQLNHLLTEQKSLLSSLYNIGILGDDSSYVVIEADSNKEGSDNKKEDIKKMKIAALKEKIRDLPDVSKIPLYEGYLTELDSLENVPIQSVYLVLFSDSLLIAVADFTDREISANFKFDIFYDLTNIAIVNVRDLGNVKQAFKLLAFPDTRVFQCKSGVIKKEWLDKLDQAKKERLASDRDTKEPSEKIIDKSPSRSSSIDVPYGNPFDENHHDDDDSNRYPEWFLEVPDDLDVAVAQRHFEEALSLLEKAKEYVKTSKNHDDLIFEDIKTKIDQKQSNLIDVLMKELEVNPDKSLQGGLRAARRAVRLLNQLNQEMPSCELFLKLCSSMLKIQCKQVKREGSTYVYTKSLTNVVFTNLCNMTEEFLKAFSSSANCISAFVVWTSHEINLFISHFIKQAFVPQTSLTTLTGCIILIRSQCERLCKYGIDLCYQIDGALRPHLSKVLNDSKDKLIDVIKVRFSEDKWTPMNLKSRNQLSRFLIEYKNFGLDLKNYITGDHWIQLTSNTMSFTKQFLILVEDCLRLQNRDLLYNIESVLYDVFEAQIKYIEFTLRNEKLSEQKLFIIKNANFLLSVVLKLTQEKFKALNQIESMKLEKLKIENVALMKGVTPAVRSIPKYSSEEFV